MIYIFLMIADIEHILSWTLFLVFFGEMSVQVFCLSFKLAIWFFALELVVGVSLT